MHEVWLWEKYYDELDAIEIESRADSPARGSSEHWREDQSSFGEDDVDDPRGRPVVRRSNDDALRPSQSNGNIDPAPPAAAAEILRQDSLTARSSKQWALTEEELLPCHYFDFMYGTSTGGLIATILGRLRMTVSEGLELYRQVGNDLFGSRRSNIPLMTKYYHEPLEKAVRAVVAARSSTRDHSDGNDLYPWPEGTPGAAVDDGETTLDVDAPRICHAACLTATHDGNLTEAYLLRSYPLYYTSATPNWITRYNEGADALPIWVATRATSAAPFYFEMVRARLPGSDEDKLFKDGGIRENNPSGAAFSEFHALYSGKAPHPALLLSLGTGRPNRSLDGFAASPSEQITTLPSPFHRLPFIAKFLENLAVFQNVLIKYTEGEHQHVATRNAARGENTWYKRLNVEGLEGMPLDDWRKGTYPPPASSPEIHDESEDDDDRKSNKTSSLCRSRLSEAPSSAPPIIPGGATLSDMKLATDKYLHREYDAVVDSYAPPQVMLRQAARKLVLQRRARQKLGGPRWEVFVGQSGTGSTIL
jgi:hypothetical protein